MHQTASKARLAKKYLFWCVNEHIDFRIPELKSVASLFKIPFKWVEKPQEDPFIILEMESEQDARRLVSRCMLVRGCYELWGEGHSHEELHRSIKQTPLSMIAPHIAKDKSFRVRVDGFNKSLLTSYKLERIQSLSYLPFEASVDLTNAITKLCLFEYYGLDNINIPEEPYRLFLGRSVGEGGRDLIARYSLKHRQFIGSTSMDAQLAFIMTNMAQLGPGSIVLDPFVGSGSVLVSAAHQGAYVWGSDIDFLTLHARTKPTRVKQQERSPDESILANLSQYGLAGQYLDVAVVDCAKTAWRGLPVLDAIITDPPYGIRESTARVGKEGPDSELTTSQKKLKRKQRFQHEKTKGIEEQSLQAAAGLVTIPSSERGTSPNGTDEAAACTPDSNGVDILMRRGSSDSDEAIKKEPTEERQSRISTKRQDNRRLDGSPHYPSKISYSLSDVFKDLLNFAAQTLVVGGRLVFWMPIFRDDYNNDSLPSHPCMEMQHNCEQVLNAHSSRRLITLLKTRAPKVGETAWAEVQPLSIQFRDKFFIASQMSREERMARKCQFPRDKRGQGLSHRLSQKHALESSQTSVDLANGMESSITHQERVGVDSQLKLALSTVEKSGLHETANGAGHPEVIKICGGESVSCPSISDERSVLRCDDDVIDQEESLSDSLRLQSQLD